MPTHETFAVSDSQPHKAAPNAHAHAETHGVKLTGDGRPRTAEQHLPSDFQISGLDSGSKEKMTPGDGEEAFAVDGKTREYEIHVPKGYDGKKELPVMYMMGGVGGGIDQMKHETGMNRVA